MIVYKIKNLYNDKSYIGQTSLLLDERFSQHIKDSRKPKYLIHKALNKYGKENFTLNVLCVCESKEVLNIMETFMIMVHKSHVSEGGYNLTWGGDGIYGYNHTEEAKKKMSEMKIGCKGRMKTEEEKRKIGEKNKINSIGNKNMLGKHHTEETKRKMSEKHKGILPWNTGTKGIVNIWNKGISPSEETRRKISETLKERNRIKRSNEISG
jgi:group I intron endonuclease